MPLLWLSLAFLAGIGLSEAVGASPWVWALAAGILILLAFFERRLLGRFERWQRWRALSFLPAAALLAALCLGAWRFETRVPEWGKQDLAFYLPHSAQVRGVIDQPPRPAGEGTRIYLQAEQLVLLDDNGEPLGDPIEVRGRMGAVLLAGQELRYGDRVELTGVLAQPPQGDRGGYLRYLNMQGIYSYMEFPLQHWVEGGAGSSFWAGLFRLRQAGVDTLDRILPQPESSLLSGILLGVEDYIPEDVEEAFRETGTAHIVAISGFNISILVSLFIGLFRRWLPRLWAILGTIVAIALYTLLVGGQASVVRAAIMGVMGLVGVELGRRQAGANSLAFTAAVMALFNPLLLWDVGFQLSFSATLGIILLGDPMQKAFTGWLERRLPAERARRITGPVGEYFLLTLAAQLATLPVILGNFGKVSLSSMIANPLILPVQPLIMILGGISLLAGMAWLPLGQLLAWLVWAPLAYTIRVVQLFAQVSGGVNVPQAFGLVLTVVFYGLIFGFGLWRKRIGRWFRLAVVMAGLTVLAALLVRIVLTLPDGRLHVILFYGGEVPVVLIRAPDGGTVLVNGGQDSTQLGDALGRWLPPVTNSLDVLVVPGKSKAAIGALPALLERYDVRQVLWNERVKYSNTSEQLLSLVQSQRAELDFMERGQEIDLGHGARLRVEVVSVEGAALSLEWGNFRMLIPGGVLPATLERQELDWPAEPGVLLLGSKDLKNNTPEGWALLYPDLVIWAGEDALAGEAGGVSWVSLHQAGWLHITTDGSQAWLESGE